MINFLKALHRSDLIIRSLLLGLVVFSSLVLAGCGAKPCPPKICEDLTREAWMGKVDNSPKRWLARSDKWFLTGNPAVGITDRHVSPNSAMTIMQVKGPDFTKINVNGNFRVQIFGTFGHNSVFAYGPNAGVRLAEIHVRNGTLCINQKRPDIFNARKVTVRIGVNQLTELVHAGANSIMAIRIPSCELKIKQMPNASGNIYLVGDVNLKRIVKLGQGSITVLGVNSPDLEIITDGVGGVNVLGKVGIRSIKHHGSTEINIVGANSNSLGIYADGSGKIGINGPVRIKEIYARGSTCIYAFPVNTDNLYVYLWDRAHVGLTGYAQSLQLSAAGTSRFGGRHLCTANAFVRAMGASHVNVSANSRAYTTSSDGSSVFFFGSPNILTKFTQDVGMIYPFSNGVNSCPISYTPYNFRIPSSAPYPAMVQGAPPRIELRGAG